MISLNNPYNAQTPKYLPLRSIQFIAPYWADVDLKAFGQVYYRQTNDPVLLARAANEIQKAFPLSKNVVVTNLFIVTWDAVGYYYRHSDKVGSYNFMLIIIFMHVHLYACTYCTYSTNH